MRRVPGPTPGWRRLPPLQWFGGRRQRVVVGFQARLAATQLVWTIALLLLFVALLVGPMIHDLRSMDERTRLDAATVLLSLHDRIWSALVAVAAALGAVTLTLTHRVAGPLYRFKQVFEAVGEGQLWVSGSIRTTDYPQEESAALEHMLRTLRTQIGRARLATQEASAAQDPAAALAAIRRADEALAFFTLDGRQPVSPPAPSGSTEGADTAAPATDVRSSSQSGLTLVELMVVVALVSVIAAIGIPQYVAAVEAARVTRAIGDVRSIDREIQAYRALEGCLPGSLADIDQQRDDPWGHPYVYNVLSPNGGGGAQGGDPGAGGGGGGGGGGADKGGKGGNAGGGGGGAGGAGGAGGGGGAAGAPDPGCRACNGVCVGTGAARKDRNLVPINSDYDFFSKGRDGMTVGPVSGGPSLDDIVRGSDGAFIGLGRDY